MFDICGLASGAGAVYVARGTVFHVMELDKIIAGALSKEGFSVVEVLSPCLPTTVGPTGSETP